ncbi:MAG TPA: glycosyltransferase [Dongiaceae bacterium]|nr:glycosyltransferase [Dongiaceae bacterium]
MSEISIMNPPVVSVIMPAYNHEHYIGQAIESVLQQSFSDFEFIIINDGSTDGTERIILGYDDPRIKYVAQKNQDAFNAINNGISLATGEYTSILNSDDLYHPDRLARLLDEARATEARFLFTGITVIDDHSQPVVDPAHKFLEWYNGLRRLYSQSCSKEQCFFMGNLAVSTSNFFFSVELVQKIGNFRQFRYAHDYDFALRALAECGNLFRFIPDSLLSYRIHGGNTITKSPAAANREVVEILVDNFPLFLQEETDRANFAALRERAILPLLERSEYLDSILDSKSWKATKPLRSLGDVLLKSGKMLPD